MKFAGKYTGKYNVGDCVVTVEGVYPSPFMGTVLVIDINQSGPHYLNAYGIHFDGRFYPDGKPHLTWLSEENIAAL